MDQIAVLGHGTGVAESGTGVMHGLAEVRGGCRRRQVGPEHVHEPLAVDPVLAGQGEDLD